MKVNFGQKLFERFIIFISVSSFFQGLLLLIQDFAVLKEVSIIKPFTYFFVLILSLFIFIVINIFFNKNSTTGNFITFLIYFVIAATAISYFLRSFLNPFLICITTFAQSMIYFNLFNPFFYHDSFEKQCINKNSVGLKKELYDNNQNLSEAAKGYTSNKSILTICGILFTLFLTVAILSNAKISLFVYICYSVYLISIFFHYFLYSYYVKEATFISDGFNNLFSFRTKIFSRVFLIFMISIILGFIFSSNYSIFKLNWIFNLFKKSSDINQLDSNRDLPMGQLEDVTSMLDDNMYGNPASSAIFNIISKILVIGLCGAVGFFILYIFLRPFIKKIFINSLKNANLKTIIKRFFRNLKKLLYKLFHLKLHLPKFSSADSNAFMENMQDLIKFSKKSKEKKLELDRLTKQFMKLIDYGTLKGINYTKNLAPLEYTSLLNNENANKAGIIFEKSLYAKECITKQEEQEFQNAIDSVVSLADNL